MRAVERNWRGDSQVSAGINGNGELNSRTEVWSDWTIGGGHYFNAINHQGRILAVDGQSGSIEAWPPSVSGLGYDASMIRLSEAIVRDRHGKVI
jgi:hypothetical protein